jgi:hypothetical protein
MATIANTADNNARVKALKKIANTKWVGNVSHDTLDKCLVAINMNSSNSGWYKPVATKINELEGYYMINESGSIFFESRVIKSGDKFLIEHLTSNAFNEFEKLYSEFLN